VARDSSPGVRDSRGLNRALLGDYAGAIEDFQVYVELWRTAPKGAQRQAWIDALRQNRNPFTTEELGKLRGSR
jgi:regulator of sirC expression with transglutaminase-like and TPR domain